jgi:hypothetical protein
MLTNRQGCNVFSLKLGGTVSNGTPCLSDDAVKLFFQRLPAMDSLSYLKVNHVATMELSQTILDGIESNYELRDMSGLTFDSDDQGTKDELMSAIAAYLKANDRGRRAIIEYIRNPSRLFLRERALHAIHDLANCTEPNVVDLDVDTCLFLCVKLFAPTRAIATLRARPPSSSLPRNHRNTRVQEAHNPLLSRVGMLEPIRLRSRDEINPVQPLVQQANNEFRSAQARMPEETRQIRSRPGPLQEESRERAVLLEPAHTRSGKRFRR